MGGPRIYEEVTDGSTITVVSEPTHGRVVLEKEGSVQSAAVSLLRSAAVAEGRWSMVVVQLIVVKRIILGFILL